MTKMWLISIVYYDEDVANIFTTDFLQDNSCERTSIETTPENKQENIKKKFANIMPSTPIT